MTDLLNKVRRTVLRNMAIAAGCTLPLAAAAADLNLEAEAGLDNLKAESAVTNLNLTAGEAGQIKNLSGLNIHLPATKAMSLDQQVTQFLKDYQPMFGVVVDEDLTFDRTIRDGYGLNHIRYQQMHRGVPVAGKSLVVHVDANRNINAVTGNLVPELDVDTTPGIREGHAMRLAKKKFQDPAILRETNELVVYRRTRSDEARLVYKIELSSMAKGIRFIIDAKNGDILDMISMLHHGSATGEGFDLQGNLIDPLRIYQGSDFPIPNNATWQDVMGSATKGSYNLVDTSSSNLGNLYTMTSGETYFETLNFVNSADTSFDSTGNSHRSGVSAHNAFRATVDYFKDKHGRNGIDNAGMPIIAIVDLGDNPETSDRENLNAFWRPDLSFMGFGSGGSGYNNFAAGLDVIGHELSHGVTDRTSGLEYQNLSGAMNEALSDMFGYLIERHAYGSANWLLGEDVKSGGFRSLSNPSSLGQPDYVGHPNYIAPVANPNGDNDNGGVHTNSGIPNKVFYLLVAGGSHRGVTVQPFSSNLGTSADQVGALMYLCNTGGYFQSDTNFEEARTQMLAACANLYPGDSTKLNAVKNAWSSVAVGEVVTNNQLENGQSKSGLSGAKGAMLRYTLEVPAGAKNLVINTTGGNGGDADLYVSRNTQPTTDSHQWKSWNSNSTESITIAAPTAGTYHILVHGYDAFSNLTLKGEYDTTTTQTQTQTVSATLAGKGEKIYDLPVSGGTIDLSATWSGSRDIDLYLINPSGSTVKAAESTNNPEVLSYNTNGVSGNWKIRVFNYSNSSTTYDLKITYQP